MLRDMLLLRRLTGIALVLACITYVVATYYNYDIPRFNAPDVIHSRAFRIGWVFATIWCFWPAMKGVPRNQPVELTPEPIQRYGGTLAHANQQVAPQSAAWGEPVYHNGNWVVQGPGGWHIHRNGTWELYWTPEG